MLQIQKSDNPKCWRKCGVTEVLATGTTILERNLSTSDKIEDKHYLQPNHFFPSNVSKPSHIAEKDMYENNLLKPCLWFKKIGNREFSGSPVVRTRCFH